MVSARSIPASASLPVGAHEDLLAERLDRALLDLVNVDPAQKLLEHAWPVVAILVDAALSRAELKRIYAGWRPKAARASSMMPASSDASVSAPVRRCSS